MPSCFVRDALGRVFTFMLMAFNFEMEMDVDVKGFVFKKILHKCQCHRSVST